MKKKWRKPTKKEIRKGIQLFLVLDSMMIGFYTVYVIAFYHLGFPLEWWAKLIAGVCGGLSTFGLLHWIGRNR